MNLSDVPAEEVSCFKKMIMNQPSLFDSGFIKKRYLGVSRKLITNPFSEQVVGEIIKSLKANAPMSVIRMGDGEMNFLSLHQYPLLPKLSYLSAKKSVSKRPHSFLINEMWLIKLERMMKEAVKNADIIGVLGLWRSRKDLTAEYFSNNIGKNIRGRWGHWAGLDYMSRLALNKRFNDKIIAPAHLYFSVIQNLSILLEEVETVHLVTNQHNVEKILSEQYPKNNFQLVNVPTTKRPLSEREPYFFSLVMNQLPKNMSNTLTLVGAGPWSELYCNWIKQRQGVAVDIGSGFDLLTGKQVRPVHNKIIAQMNIKKNNN